MPSLNNVTLMGHLGADPEIKDWDDRVVVNLRLATSKKWTDRATGEPREETQWHRVDYWGPGWLADWASNLEKGDLVLVEGELVYRSWEDKEGNKRTTATVRARKVHSLSRRKPSGPDGH